MAIVEIYIKNFKMGGSVITTSTLLQSVPLTLSDTNLIEPKVKTEMGKAPSLEFAMDVDHPYYDALMQMKTLMRVTFAGITIFRGRVLTIDVDMMGRKAVHCEGDFAFLMDTPQDGTEEKNRAAISLETYLQQLIDKHNSMCGDDDHKFILGEYPGHYSSGITYEQQIIPAAEQAVQKFGNSSWNTTMDRFEDVLNTFGGYWQTRYVDESHVYLDWLDLYFKPYDESRQRIEVANNLIEFGGSNELDNIFTAVIPIGKQDNKELFLTDYWYSIAPGHAAVNYILVPEIVSLGIFTDAELSKGYHTKEDYANAINNFGMIYKSVTFENADNCDKLFSYATDWIKNNFLGSVTSYDITALDISNIDPETSPLVVGDEVKVVHPAIGERTLTIISIDYDLYNPWKTKYKIGSPNNLLNATYGVAKKKSGGKKSDGPSSSGGGGGGGYEEPTQQQLDKQHADSEYIKKTEFGKDIQMDEPLSFLFHDDHGNKVDAKDLKSKFKGKPQLLREFTKVLKDPAFANDPEFVIQSGLYPNLKEEQQKWRRNVETYLVDECGVDRDKAEIITNSRAGTTWLANIIDDQGHLKPPWCFKQNADKLADMALRTRKALNGTLDNETAAPLFGVHGMQFAENLLGVDLDLDGGNFVYDSENQLFDFGNGKVKMDATGKTVEFDDMQVIRKEVGPTGETRSFGFYDEGNLTAGVMVEKLSNGVTKTKISSDWIDLDSDQTIIKVKNFIGNVTGVSEDNWDSYKGITLKQIDASAVWQNRDDITNVVGEFEIVGTGDNRHVVIKSGGGMRIRKNGVEYGLYDEDNLTAGLMVDKINGDETVAKIKASRVDLGAYATVGRLEAVEAKIDDLMAGRIQASVISASKIIAGKLVTTDTPSGQDVPVSVDADWHNFTVDGKKLASFLGTADINFNIADTDTYKAAIGVKSIYLTDDSTPPSYSNGYLSVPVSAMPNAGGEARATLSVDASNAYSSGYSNGYSKGKSDGGALSDAWNGATYTVTSGSGAQKQISLSHNNPSWNSSTGTAGSLTYYIYAGGDTRLSIWVSGATPYNQGHSDGYSEGYNAGWNACIDEASQHSTKCLTRYSNWNSGSAANLYVAPTSGANIATGKKQVWRYGGTVDTLYSLPAKK